VGCVFGGADIEQASGEGPSNCSETLHWRKLQASKKNGVSARGRSLSASEKGGRESGGTGLGSVGRELPERPLESGGGAENAGQTEDFKTSQVRRHEVSSEGLTSQRISLRWASFFKSKRWWPGRDHILILEKKNGYS